MGGGNSLNIIRVPSVNEVKNIIFTTDLNGSIAPGNSDTWHHIINGGIHFLWWSQNNEKDTAYVTVSNQYLFSKDINYQPALDTITTFRPVIEYRE